MLGEIAAHRTPGSRISQPLSGAEPQPQPEPEPEPEPGPGTMARTFWRSRATHRRPGFSDTISGLKLVISNKVGFGDSKNIYLLTKLLLILA